MQKKKEKRTQKRTQAHIHVLVDAYTRFTRTRIHTTQVRVPFFARKQKRAQKGLEQKGTSLSACEV